LRDAFKKFRIKTQKPRWKKPLRPEQREEMIERLEDWREKQAAGSQGSGQKEGAVPSPVFRTNRSNYSAADWTVGAGIDSRETSTGVCPRCS
jgi:hypothetical protein